MTDKIIFLQPIIEYKVWGGIRLKEFNFQLNTNNAGEAWLISCFPDKSNQIINNSKYECLYDFFMNEKPFFNNYQNTYPLLSKIIDAKQDLSVQVHPDNDYAKINHNGQLGKTESWYILDCFPNSTIIYGHTAKNFQELSNLIYSKQWKKLLVERPIQKNDFLYVPSGMVHAIKENTLVFELQQSSDITYRLYDYDRLDKGKLRELHIKQSLDVISLPGKNDYNDLANQHDNYLVDNDVFKLLKIKNVGVNDYYFPQANWLQCTVIDGSGMIDYFSIEKGSSFLIAHNCTFSITGSLQLLLSYV